MRLLAAAALGLGTLALAPPSSAAVTPSAEFVPAVGASGSWTSPSGALFARQGAALSLKVTADGTRCVEVYDGAGALTARQGQSTAQSTLTLTGGSWLTAGGGTGAVSYTVRTYSGWNSNQDKCTGNVDKTLGASYTLDNTAPTASAELSPAPNAAGWNRSDVTVTWSARDEAGGSGATAPSPITQAVTTEGTSTRTTTVSDNVGNSATSAPVTVRVDRTAPAITGSRTPAPNAEGWNNTDVTVSFSSSDGTSGIKDSTAPVTVGGNGANQSVTGTATDVADNSARTTVGGINIDKVAPTLSGKPTSGPGPNGWWNGDVTIAWTVTDTLSGATTPADTTLTGEGAGLTATASTTDRAGNSSGTVQSAPVSIDRTAPRTTVTAPPAWNRGDVTLALAATDSLSGVARTHWILDGGAEQAGTDVPVSGEGRHTLTFWSTDRAGNDEPRQSVSFGIDSTAPAIGHTQDPAANADGWNSSAVTVTFTCSDGLSGVVACTDPQRVTSEGAAQDVTGTARDEAGNTATDHASVSIDETAPSLSVDSLPTPNQRGWYATPVTATFTATDELSGVKSLDGAHTFGEGADQTATATATDAAGNRSSVTTRPVSVDTTPPSITGRLLGDPGPGGWFGDDVTVRWSCDDNLSGVVACPGDTVVAGEGASLAAGGTVEDRAGNTSYASVGGIRIDRTPPTTTATGVPAGWVDAPVSVGLTASDNLSDVESTWYAVDGGDPTRGTSVDLGSEGVHTVEYWSVDRAGNTEARQSFAVRLDLSAPEITATQSPDANAQGWNNTDVAVSFSCLDQVELSGLADCPAPQVLTAEGRAQKVSGTAVDHAGNRVDATATVNIDKTPPSISGAPDRAPNAAGWYDGDVTVAFTAGDPLSGILEATGPQHVGEGEDQSVLGVATDNAGNTASTTVAHLDVDETAPDLSAAPTTLPNAHGWYDHDVRLVWAASDALSGLAGDVPADAVISTEGEGQTVSAAVRDVAGNRTEATSEPVDIDKTAPTTDASAPGGWSNGSVEVTLAPHDALSGVASTRYRVDDGPAQEGTTVPLSEEGVHTIAYASTDRAGNTEDEHTVTVRIDRSAPTIGHGLAPAPNRNGWNRDDVTVTFTCADQDGLSGVAECTAPQQVTQETAGEEVRGTATDNAGNSAVDSATVRLDRTPPRLQASRTPAANHRGWNNTDVTVHFDATDPLSGLDELTPDRVLGEGTDQAVDGTAVDAAGNASTTTVGGINVDETAPTLRGKPAESPNASGWYAGDVTIDWDAADDRSGVVSSPSPTTIRGEGAGLRATATVEDAAGNDTTADSRPVDIDRTPPVTGADAPAGWSGTSVTISLAASDGLSGVAATYSTVDGGDRQEGTTLTVGTEGVHTVRYWSVDEAGNVEAPHAAEVRIDLTRPTIGHEVRPAPNAAGWNRGPVTVSYQCDDALSGVASCSPDVEVSTDGADQAVPGTAVDRAGNARTDDARVSIDSVDPTVHGAPDRAANTNGWYAGDVTVAFTCDDGLSGIARCTSPVRVGEGAGQTVEGSATDAAGNDGTVAVGPLDVDETAPTLRGTVTGEPNADGWYRDDVVVHWTAGDELSGLDGPAPADSRITSEGVGLTVGATVRDLAGNATSATSRPVSIDRTAPRTTVSDVSGWSNHAVTVDLAASDNLSGVAATRYRLDDGEVAQGDQLTIDTEGVHTLQVWSVDRAGNAEARQDVEVRIDRTAPGIEHSQSPAANARGWNHSDVTVTFTCADTGSGIADCTDPVTRGEGAGQRVDGTATDRAGNTASDQAVVNVDETAPTVTGALSAAPNANGWFRSDVVGTYTCADQDALSGVLSCPDPVTFGEGRGQGAGGRATDAADNTSAEFRFAGVDVDETRPSLSGVVVTDANDDGWYRDDVVVRWTADDALSGVDQAPADSTVTGEGDDLAATAAVSDLAGNTRSATVSGIHIDRTPPSTHATAPQGWQASDATVRFDASDALSGVAATHYAVDGGDAQVGTSVSIGREGTHRVTFWSVDRAGNKETPSTVTVMVDKTPPTIEGHATTAPNAAGWWRTPVTVAFSCADAVSGMASCQPDTTVGAQGANSVTGTAVDNAGNRASTTVDGLRVDTVAPTVGVDGVQDGATYVVGAVPTATATASDATSGLGGPASLTTSGGNSAGVGTFTTTATATDRAGNTRSATVTYRVVYGYGATLFLQPVNDTAHQTGVSTSVFNAGQTIPMKLQLRNAAGQVIRSATAPGWLTPVRGSSTSAAVNETAYSATGSVGSAYTWDGTQYLYGWKTEKSQAGSYWRVGVALDDGQTYYVNVGLR